MSAYISIAQAFAQWQELIKECGVSDDGPAMSESWNNYTDSLCKDGQLCDLQYHYCPAWDDEMPGTGGQWDALSDDREFILERMGLTMDAKFVPFSQSRNKGEKHPSLNWSVTIKKDGREVLTTDYMQGSGHTTAYKNPVRFNNPKRDLDQHTTNKNIREECETGRICAPGFKGKVDAPDLADVLHSLLLDSSALDCRDFEDWCGDLGFEPDSIKARSIYDACIAIGLKMRGTFGDKTMRELHELFEGM